jgi:hypothetical protein
MRRAKRAWGKVFPSPVVPQKVGKVRCREITPDDLEQITDLLMKGFWRAPRQYWQHVLNVLTMHNTPDGYPKYGYMLENDHVAVGVLLMIFTERVENGITCIRCSESSYYVDPAFRFYASLLVQRGHRFKDVTYLDCTARPDRYRTLDAQGYKRINTGSYASYPMLSRPVPGSVVRKVTGPISDCRLSAADNDLLARHATYKPCIPVIVEHAGMLYPFVFAMRRSRGGMPISFLIYSRNQADYATFAGTLGRFLARRGIFKVMLDVKEPIPVPGKLQQEQPKYWKGGSAPRVGDLAYTEIAMFGA